MSTRFPNIKPATRQFTGGVYPVKIYRSLAGTSFKRSFGNKPGGYRLRLGFNNIKDDATELLLKHYYDTDGGFVRFPLSPSLFVGMSSELATLTQSPALIRWEYEGPPEIESVYKGISNVTINLIGELNV